ncbi:hypothetical protein ACQY1H_23630 (plasmid) [Agrobacterium vitis]|uniref:hypothetical protein n=1 Tax=Agrobacterium vitis TaxID=373 RepID=UPI003D29DDCE
MTLSFLLLVDRENWHHLRRRTLMFVNLPELKSRDCGIRTAAPLSRPSRGSPSALFASESG